MKNKISLLLIVLIAATAVTYYILNNKIKNNEVSTTLPPQFKIGNVNDCRKVPGFIKSLKMRQPAIDSKQQDHLGGLLIRDITNTSNTWMHQSWGLSGFIGGFDRDSKGNIYVAPMPYVSLTKNPPILQNQIYIIDNKTAQMSLLLKLPNAEKANNKNPFGVMGMFYDCDTNSLYVSSIAGSKPQGENGVIYQIDLKSNQVVSSFAHVDAIGVGVFNTLKTKRLYLGSARNPYVYSVALNEKGHFVGDKRFELSLAELKGGNTTIVKKFIFKKLKNKFQMSLKEMEFGFRLMAENNLSLKQYHFQYSLSKDQWLFQNTSRD